MRPALAASATAQHGVFTRQQSLRAGYTDREISALVRPHGPWMVVRHGVYCERELVAPLALRERWLLKDRAAVLGSQRPARLSHDSAARLLRIDTLDVDRPGTHLTLHGRGGCRTNAGVTRHRDLLPLCTEVVDDLAATSYARTAIDIGRLHGYLPGLVAVDSVRHRGVPLTDLHAELARMENHPHIARARAAVMASDPGAESVLETLARQLVEELDIGAVETQFAIRLDDGQIVWCDIRVGCHIFECESFLKLVSVDDGGVATEPPEKVLWKQQGRLTKICALGLGASRITWGDNFGEARQTAIVRLRREFEVTTSRFGRDLPEDLRRFADAHPRRRPSDLWTPSDRIAA